MYRDRYTPRGRASFPAFRSTLAQHHEQTRRAALVMFEYRRLLSAHGFSVTDDELVCKDDAEVELAKALFQKAQRVTEKET